MISSSQSQHNAASHKDLAIVWLRRDLRLGDNPALSQALARHQQVLCVYIHDNQLDKELPGQAAGWWRQQALLDLQQQLQGKLLLLAGEPLTLLSELVDGYGATALYWNRLYEPDEIARDSRIKSALSEKGIAVQSFAAALLFEPWQLLKQDGAPFKVFTPFYKQCLKQGLSSDPLPPVQVDESLLAVEFDQALLRRISPQKAWKDSFAEFWQATSMGVQQRLDELEQVVPNYARQRDFPAQPGVTRLAPYLHFGQISPRQILARIEPLAGKDALARQLVWRDFAHSVLYHWPDTVAQPMDPRFAAWPWRKDDAGLRAWQQGQTGVPIIDAAMRELWYSGYMHNRCRMLVASYLTKHLLIDWREGARWFMYTLLDADVANNTLGWQWCAGSGVDAAPYFRIFNPDLQARKFDAEQAYIKHWLAYPAPLEPDFEVAPRAFKPIVDLQAGRERALALWKEMNSTEK